MGDLLIIKRQKKFDPNFQKFFFCTSAAGTDPEREVFRHIHSTGKEIICTDSRRMHIAEMELEPGNWFILKRAKSEIIIHRAEDNSINFPNWKQVVPDCTDYLKTEFRATSTHPYSGVVMLLKRLPLKTGINYEYLNDLKGHEWDVYYSRENFKIIKFENVYSGLTALIMPMQLKYNGEDE
ncbi:MAG: hypothetical protein KA369_08420 [Spirochaetes bacterium]|nr:hypothetical protein [Spirochaetota bacterium]